MASAVAVNELDTHYLTQNQLRRASRSGMPLSSWDRGRVPDPRPSSGLFGTLTLAEADTWTSAVLVDEFDAGQLKGPSLYGKSCVTRLRSVALE
jgi:hypothetical protein